MCFRRGGRILVDASRPIFAERAGLLLKKRRSAEETKPIPSEPQTGSDESTTRDYWIVSPNVTDNSRTIAEWKEATNSIKAAFMGWGPEEQKHRKIGYMFAHEIKAGDILLIARRSGGKPDVVGLGVVDGPFRTLFRGFRPPKGDNWHGSLRTLSPYIELARPPRNIPLMSVLRHTMALRKLVPSRTTAEGTVCDWLESVLNGEQSAGSQGAGRKPTGTKSPGGSARPTKLPHHREMEFEVRTSAQLRLAIKREERLVRAYRNWLGERHRNLTGTKFGKLQCDGYEIERGNLIEAKASAKREYIRMAVGQLLDYANLGEGSYGKPNMGILLPERPAIDIERWLKGKLGISVIWREKGIFRDNANGQFTKARQLGMQSGTGHRR